MTRTRITEGTITAEDWLAFGLWQLIQFVFFFSINFVIYGLAWGPVKL